MFEQVTYGWWSARDELQDRIYQGVLKMSPALMVLRSAVASRRGGTVRMHDGEDLTLDRELRVRGADVDACVLQAVEAMRPSFGFMSSTSRFAAEVLEMRYDDRDKELVAHVIWGVA